MSLLLSLRFTYALSAGIGILIYLTALFASRLSTAIIINDSPPDITNTEFINAYVYRDLQQRAIVILVSDPDSSDRRQGQALRIFAEEGLAAVGVSASMQDANACGRAVAHLIRKFRQLPRYRSVKVYLVCSGNIGRYILQNLELFHPSDIDALVGFLPPPPPDEDSRSIVRCGEMGKRHITPQRRNALCVLTGWDKHKREAALLRNDLQSWGFTSVQIKEIQSMGDSLEFEYATMRAAAEYLRGFVRIGYKYDNTRMNELESQRLAPQELQRICEVARRRSCKVYGYSPGLYETANMPMAVASCVPAFLQRVMQNYLPVVGDEHDPYRVAQRILLMIRSDVDIDTSAKADTAEPDSKGLSAAWECRRVSARQLNHLCARGLAALGVVAEVANDQLQVRYGNEWCVVSTSDFWSLSP